MAKPIMHDATPEAIGFATRNLVESYLADDPVLVLPTSFFERIERFALELVRWGAKLNLTAAPDDPAELAYHILESLTPVLLPFSGQAARLCGAFAAGNEVLDLGSGAGFPGLILASATNAKFTLIESRRKRASFLNAAAAAMGLANVHVENVRRTGFAPDFDVVTARAFARPALFYEVAPSAVKPGGMLILYASLRQKSDIDDALSHRGYANAIFEYAPLRPQVRPSYQAGHSAPHIIVVSRAQG